MPAFLDALHRVASRLIGGCCKGYPRKSSARTGDTPAAKAIAGFALTCMHRKAPFAGLLFDCAGPCSRRGVATTNFISLNCRRASADNCGTARSLPLFVTPAGPSKDRSEFSARSATSTIVRSRD